MTVQKDFHRTVNSEETKNYNAADFCAVSSFAHWKNPLCLGLGIILDSVPFGVFKALNVLTIISLGMISLLQRRLLWRAIGSTTPGSFLCKDF